MLGLAGELFVQFLLVLPGAFIRTIFAVIFSGFRKPFGQTFKSILKDNWEANSVVAVITVGLIFILTIIL